MSPRAAWRLEALGFTDIYLYAAGKSDWGAYGLPLEGTVTKVARITDVVRTDVPTCGVDDSVAVARERMADQDMCIVVNAERIVLGRMGKKELDADPRSRVGDVMRPGPSTFRPNVTAIEMLDYMDRNELQTALVTTPDGRLLGLALREDVARTAERRG